MKTKIFSGLIIAGATIAIGATTAFANETEPKTEFAETNGEMASDTFFKWEMGSEAPSQKEEETTTLPETLTEQTKEVTGEPAFIFEMNLIAVSPQDESKFSAEEWEDILDKVETGEIRWEE